MDGKLRYGYSSLSAAAAAAKSLQSCPTLCDPIDGSPSGSPVPGILQARTLERVAISFSTNLSACWHKSLWSSCLSACQWNMAFSKGEFLDNALFWLLSLLCFAPQTSGMFPGIVSWEKCLCLNPCLIILMELSPFILQWTESRDPKHSVIHLTAWFQQSCTDLTFNTGWMTFWICFSNAFFYEHRLVCNIKQFPRLVKACY